MKVLFLIHSLRRGGAERVVLNQAEGLVQKGHTIQIISWLDNDEYKDEYPNLERHHLIKAGEYKWIRSLRSSSKILSFRINSFKPDIIQVHTPTVAWLLGMIKNEVPAIHILHGYGSIDYSFSFKNFLNRMISRFFASKTRNKFVTVSPSMNFLASKYYSNSLDDFTVIPNGIDLKKFPFIIKEDLQMHQSNPKILMIGTLTANKGQLLGIDCFKLILQDFPSAKLILIGDGPDKSTIKKKIKKFNLEASIEVLGLQSNIQDFLSKGSILWQFSKTEAMPMTILESMSSGLPTIGFDVQGINDTIVDNKTGFLVSYGDVEQAALKTANILTDHILYRKLSSNSRERIIQKYSNDQMVNSYEKVMEKLL